MNVHDTTGKGLLESFLEEVHSLQLNIADMRGQAYDNGANMKGKKKGVQARMLELNSRALYLPCSSHTLNLVITDAAKSSNYGVGFLVLLIESTLYFPHHLADGILYEHICQFLLRVFLIHDGKRGLKH